MNRKVLVVIVALIAVALLATPVFAAPATKIEEVTLTAATTTASNPGYPRMSSHDTISHGRGTSVGTCTLTINGVPLGGGWYSEWVSRAKLSQDPAESEVLIASIVVLTFTGEGTTGTFRGIVQRLIIGYPPGPSSYFEDHVVLHGTGDFRGQTLKLSFAGTPPLIQEGCLIIPK